MIQFKTPVEIEKMREASAILKRTHKLIAKSIRPGITTKQLDKIATDFISKNNATPSFKGYQGFPASICASPNEQVVHGIPNDAPLQQGDIVSIDIGVFKNGYHGDAARTYAVGNIDENLKNLISAAKYAFYYGLEGIKLGDKIGDISARIQEYVESKGYGLVTALVGHGIGKSLHEDPSVPNYGTKGSGDVIKEGLAIAIEPMIALGTGEVEFKSDGWTCVTKDNKPAAHYENTVVFTKNGVEILTG